MMVEERLISAQVREEDRDTDFNLRPRRLDEYIGQVKVKEMISIFIQAARERKEVLDHVLLFGPDRVKQHCHIIALKWVLISGPHPARPSSGRGPGGHIDQPDARGYFVY